MSYEHITTEDADGVAVVTLNRPDQMNAWTWRMGIEFRHAVGEFDAREDIRVIVATGAGRAFCAGADLTREPGLTDEQLAALQAEVAQRLRPRTEEPYWRLATPIIAAMNGSAAGIGMTLPMQLDMRIMAEGAKYGFVFNRRGFVPELGSTWMLPRLIGTAKAMDVLLTGRYFNGTEAAAMGFATEALPAGQVLDRALELAGDIARNTAPVSAAITKQMIYRNLEDNDRDTVVEREAKLFHWSTRSPDGVEGAKAFMGKRPPEWTMSKHADFPHELFDS
jgi:enoyl-CoA hydratase/carnithine racemase